MQRARTTGPDREATLRRVAIVLSSLPETVRAQLMQSIGGESRRRLLQTIESLTDIDPLERKRALQAFKGSFVSAQSHHPQTSADLGTGEWASPELPVEQATHRSGAQVLSGTAAAQMTAAPQSESALAFLSDVDDDTLVRLLAGEHPQTIALVLASIAPAQAARILPSLDARLQGEALSRIGRLGEIPEDAVGDIAAHLRSRVTEPQNKEPQEAGRRALGAILAELPRTPMAPDGGVAPGGVNSDAPVASGPRGATGATVDPMSQGSPDQLSAVDQTHRLRSIAQSWEEPPASEAPAQSFSPDTSDPISDSDITVDEQAAVLASTQRIHQYLISLTPQQLCGALGAVPTRTAMLALCGLPNDVAQSVLAVLPRSQAKQVRRDMASLHSLQLREIDEAKESVAQTSMDQRATRDSFPASSIPAAKLAA